MFTKRRTRRASGWSFSLLALVSFALFYVALVGCGPKARTVAGGKSTEIKQEAKRPAIEQDLPLLRWVPADAEMVIVAESLTSLEKLSFIAEPFAAAIGVSTGELFNSPWLREGIDPLADIVLFTRGRDITLVAVQTAEAQANPAALHSAWTSLAGQAAAVTWNMQPGSQASGDWLEVMQAAAAGTGFSALPSATQSLVGEGKAAIRGHLPVLSLLASAVGGEEFLSCLPLLRAAGGLRFEARLEPDGTATARVSMPLQPSSLAAVSAVLGPGPSPGLVALRQTEAAHLSLGLDLPVAATAFREQSCPELAYEIERALQNIPMRPPPRAIHAVGTRFDPSELSGKMALQMPLRSKRFLANQLGRIPARSLFESSVKINGQSVKKLSVPTMASIYYQLSDSQFLFATKKALMTAILSPAAAPSREVAAVGLWPARLPQLRQFLGQLVPSRDAADLWYGILLRFEYAGMTIALDDDALSMRVAVRPAR